MVTRGVRASVKCGRLLLHAVTPDSFLEEICTMLAGDEGYRGAWAGACESVEDLTIRLVAVRGTLPYACEPDRERMRLPRAVRGAVKLAVQTREPQCLPVIGTVYHSIVIPLVADDECMGVLLVTAGMPDCFAAAEIPAFARLGAEIGCGLRALVHLDERYEIEERLYRQTEFAASVMDSVGTLLIVLDPLGRVIVFNHACEQLTGFTEQEVRGARLGELFLPLDATYEPKFDTIERDVTHYPMSNEVTWLTRSAERRAISLTQTAVAGTDGELEFVIVSGVDITEQRRAEAALALRERYLNGLSELAQLLLSASSPLPAYEVIETLGKSAQASAACFVQNCRGAIGDLCGVTRARWRDGHQAWKAHSVPDDFSYSTGGMRQWVGMLSGGEVVNELVARMTPAQQEGMELDGVAAVCVIPIITGGKFTGFIRLDRCGDTARTWTKSEIGLLSTAAAMVAQSMLRAKAEHERRTLQRLARRLTGPLTFREIGRIVADECRRLFRHHAMALGAIDETQRFMIGIHAEDTPPGGAIPQECPAADYPLWNPETGARQWQGVAKLINREVNEEPSGTLAFPTSPRPSKSLMFVPVTFEDQMVGSLTVQSYIPGFYMDADLQLLATFADHCGGAIYRAQADAVLRRNEELFARAQEIAHIGSWDFDLQSRRPVWSEETYRILGYFPGEVEASEAQYYEHIHPDDRERVYRDAEAFHRGESNFHAQYRIIRTDGAVREVVASGRIYKTQGGELVRMVGILMDITERLAVEKAIAASERMYRQVIEVSGGVPYRYRFGPLADEDRYEFVGEAIRQLVGVPAGRLTPSLMASMRAATLTDQVAEGTDYETDWEMCRRGELDRLDCIYELRLPSGETKMVRDTAVPLRDATTGAITGMLGIMRDASLVEAGATLEAW